MAMVGLSYLLILLVMTGMVSSDMNKDREDCAQQLVGLATCLPYVGGDAKSPTLDCCTGLKQILIKGKKCLCILVKDRNDPSLGLKINATLALSLPTACHAPANVSECPSLLHLAPNSPDAKVFEQFANSSKGTTPVPSGKVNSSGSSDSGSSAQEKSDGRRGKRWRGEEMVGGVSLYCFTSFFIFIFGV